jgi:hypothetical protein
MKIGNYEINHYAILTGLRILKASMTTRLFPFDKKRSRDAEEVIEGNVRDGIIRSGSLQFKYMWVVDLGVGFRGIKTVIDGDLIRSILERMVDESARKGYVPSCFSSNSSFDIPWKRADNLPWLIFMLKEEGGLLEERGDEVELLFKNWVAGNFDMGEIKKEVKGDWIDTYLRPSSTYNNLCALKMFKILEPYASIKDGTEELEDSLLKKRWTNGHFIDYEGSGDYLVGDANGLALYFELFDREIREEIAETLITSGLMDPIPMRLGVYNGYGHEMRPFFTNFSSSYHTTSVWPHLGLMALNGLKKLGKEYERYKRSIEALIEDEGFIEVLGKRGRPYSTIFHRSERNLTMFAGQYLELLG